MKKKVSILLALVLAFTMCASIMTAYAADPVVYDFTKDGIACVGDKTSGDAKFFGKAKRFDYKYENGLSKLIFVDPTDEKANNPYIVNADANIDANTYKFAKIAYCTESKAANLQFYFAPDADFTGHNVAAPITGDGKWQAAVIDLSAVAGWSGTVKQIRYDFLYGGEIAVGDFVYCGYIAFFDSADAANNYNPALPNPDGSAPVDSTAPSFTLDKAKYEIKDGNFSMKVTFKNAPAADTWFGIYPADVAATITEKETLGMWLYTNGSKTASEAVTADGTITFTKEAIDAGKESNLKPGDYKLIMFKGGSADETYTILDSKTFSLAAASDTTNPPKTGDTGIILTLAAVAIVLSAAVICFKKRTEA